MTKVSEQFIKKIKRLPSPVLRDFLEQAAEELPVSVLKDFLGKIPKRPPTIEEMEYERFRDWFQEENPTPELIDELEKKKPEDYFMAKFPNWDLMGKMTLRKAIRGYFKVEDVAERMPLSQFVEWRLTKEIPT